jgi:hypothetical protein
MANSSLTRASDAAVTLKESSLFTVGSDSVESRIGTESPSAVIFNSKERSPFAKASNERVYSFPPSIG